MENKSKKVLVLVEDDEVLARVLDTVLTGAGYIVKIDYSGATSEETIRREKPDCVLLDILLPVKNGFEILEGLMKDETTRNIPVIILSNLGQDSEVKKGMELGAKNYIVKSNVDVYDIPKIVAKYI